MLDASSANAELPVDAVLPKYADQLTSDDYASLLVGLSRKAHWRTADDVVGWLNNNTNVALPWNVFVLTARERIKLGYMDAAVQALDWIRRYGFALSGSALEVIAELKLAYENKEIYLEDTQSLDALVGWAQTTNAGKALWSTFVSDEYQSRVGVINADGEVDYKEHTPDVFEAARDAGFDERDVRTGKQKVIIGSTGAPYTAIDDVVQQAKQSASGSAPPSRRQQSQ